MYLLILFLPSSKGVSFQWFHHLSTFKGGFFDFNPLICHRHLVVFDTAVAILADACFHLLHLHHCWCSHTIHGCTICSWHGAGCVGAHGTLVKTETNKIHSSFQESKNMWHCFRMEICWKYMEIWWFWNWGRHWTLSMYKPFFWPR